MVSATHYIECITVQNGPPDVITCGGCQLPGSGSWSITGKSNGNTYFNNRASFGAGKYRLTYVGATRISRPSCPASSDFSWLVQRAPEPIASSGSIDFSKWSSFTYKKATGSFKPDIWQINNDGASQLINGEPTFFVSDTKQIDKSFSVNIRVGNPVYETWFDDDIFGVTWGFSENSKTSKPDNYYVLMWQGTGANNNGVYGPRLMRVVNGSAFTESRIKTSLNYGTNYTSGSSQAVTLAYGPRVDWNFNTSYIFTVVYKSDGSSVCRIAEASGKVIWETSYRDTQSLGSGKYGFFNLSQEQVRYITQATGDAQPIAYGPEGSVCTIGKDGVTFNGQSDDITILYKNTDNITVDYDGIAGSPMTFTIPAKHVLFRATSGFIIGSSPGIPGAPKTAQKTFKAGTNTHVVPEGTLATVGTGSVSDFTADGFVVKSWGEKLPINLLAQNGWIDKSSNFNFKMALVPCGIGSVFVQSVVANGIVYPPPSTNYDWKLIEDDDGEVTQINDLPTSPGDTIEFTVEDDTQIAVQLLESPSDLTNPQFRLQRLSAVIKEPKQVTWTQKNPGGRALSYDFDVEIGDKVYSTASLDDIGSFYINGNQWSPGNKGILALGSLTVTLFIPTDTEEKTAKITSFVSGAVTYPSWSPAPVFGTGTGTEDTGDNRIIGEIQTAKIVPRKIVRYPLKFNRDLHDPRVANLTAKIIAYQRGLNLSSYTPYLYTNSNLVLITWHAALSNTDVLVCIAKEVSTTTQVLYHLRTTRGILTHRNV